MRGRVRARARAGVRVGVRVRVRISVRVSVRGLPPPGESALAESEAMDMSESCIHG